jgi:porin
MRSTAAIENRLLRNHSSGRGPWRPLLAIACAFLLVRAGRAAGAEDAAPEPGWMERATLSGEWGGRGTELATQGFEFGLSLYGDVMFVVDGGLERGTAFAGLLEPTLTVDLDRALGWKNTTIFVHGIGTFGNDPTELTGSLHAPSSFGNSVDTFSLFEAWIEREFLDNSLSVRAGLYGVDTEFDVKETAGVFINGGFGTGIDLAQSGLNGPCIFPTSCLGIRVRYEPTTTRYFQIAVLDGVAGDPGNPKGTHIHLSHDDGVLVLGEAGFERAAEQERFLRAAVGTWHYTTTFDDLLKVDAAGQPVRRHGTQGVYALLEGVLYREPDRRTQGLSAFLRMGMADQDVNPVRCTVGGGLAYTGLMPGRDEDVTGLGASVAINGDVFRKSRSLAGTPVDRREVLVGLTHLLPLTPWASVQLDAQYIGNPGTDPTVDDALVIGLRFQIKF